MTRPEISVTAQPQMQAHSYFDDVEVPITIVNRSEQRLLIETIGLRFATDASAISVSHRCDVPIEPHKSLEQIVHVTPTPRYLTYTNIFRIRVQFREILDGGVGVQVTHTHQGPPSPFLIIHPCQKKLGRAFISFKQPDDRPLADLLERFLSRAGFEPYLAERQPAPGTDVWERIVRDLGASTCAFILWTQHTAWGDGVEREIDLIRKIGLPHALILEEGERTPAEFENTDIERIEFNRRYAHEPLETAVMAIRSQVLAR